MVDVEVVDDSGEELDVDEPVVISVGLTSDFAPLSLQAAAAKAAAEIRNIRRESGAIEQVLPVTQCSRDPDEHSFT